MRQALAAAVLVACHAQPRMVPSEEQRIERIEDGLLPTVVIKGRTGTGRPITERMAKLGVPGASVAVIEGERPVWARSYGVPAGTRFQAASISKTVAALAALRLVADGKLALDEDVNRRLRSWQLPGGAGVTLRRLLGHTAGVGVRRVPGYPQGAPLPTLRQILDGAPPATSPPVRVEDPPGAGFHPSDGGYVIVQQLIEDVTGEPFAAVAGRLVIAPLGMTASTYEPAGAGRVYPEQAAAGLWTTPSDLARLAVELVRLEDGRSQLLPPDLGRAMTARGPGDHGLGVEVSGEGRARSLGHRGDNDDFRCAMTIYPATGQGAAIMVTGHQGGALVNEWLQAVATEYAWPGAHGPVEREVAHVDAASYDALAGRYAVTPAVALTIRRDGDHLFVDTPGGDSAELYPQAPDVFFVLDEDTTVRFVRDPAGKVTALVAKVRGREITAPRQPGD